MPRTAGAELSADTVVGGAQVALGFLIGALGACLILLARDLAVDRTQLGWLSAGFGVALLAAGPLGPVLLARGGHPALRAGAAVLAAGAVTLALAPVLVLAELGAVLFGIGGAAIVLATPALLNDPAAARRLSRVSALASLAGAAAPVALSLADTLPGTGRLALLLPVPLLVWVVAVRGPAPSTVDSEPGVVAGTACPGRVLARWAAIVLAVTAEFAFAVWAAARLQDSGLAVPTAAAAAAAFPLGMAAGRFGTAWLLTRVPVVPLSAALVLLATAVLAGPAAPVLCAAALAVAGLGIAALYPVTLADLMHEPGLSHGRAAALGATASGTAILAGPLLINLIAHATTLRTAFLVVIPLLLALLALRRRPRAVRSAR
jgi:MFS family permease